MGFNLATMIKELEEILAKDQKAAKTAKEVAKALAWWKKYAKECGQIK